jgi:chitinase
VAPSKVPATRDRGRLVLGAALVLLLTACGAQGTPADAIGSPETTPMQETDFRIVGYVTDTGPLAGEDQLAQLTHVNYAFALPRADGTLFEIANDWKLDGYVETAHRHGGKVLISVGGWGWDDEFEALAGSDESRATFVAAVVALVEKHGLDGADIDWEYPDPGASSQAFTALMGELRSALPDGALLTAAVAALGPNAEGVAEDVFALVDFLNVMAYDGDGDDGHSPMAYAEDALAYWADRGLAVEKTVLGVPFYSRPQEVAYRDLVEADPSAPDHDEIDYYTSVVNYNGLDTMRAKTELAMSQASGIMFWTLHDDTTDTTSLLRAIVETAGE